MKCLKISHKEGYAIVQLNRGKVNAINLEFVRELNEVFQTFQEDDQIRGVIITGQPHFFTAGLDVIELYEYDKATISTFMIEFGQFYSTLAKFPKPLIAAITGHAPAGGTVIAIACDYRVMADGEKYGLGLNEILVNIDLSEDVINGYAFWLGQGLANQYLLEGRLMNGKAAQAVGFVNDCCPLENVLARAEHQMQQYLKADTRIFQSIKYKSRKQWLDNMGASSEQDLQQALDIWWSPDVRNRLKGFVERLTKK